MESCIEPKREPGPVALEPGPHDEEDRLVVCRLKTDTPAKVLSAGGPMLCWIEAARRHYEEHTQSDSVNLQAP